MSWIFYALICAFSLATTDALSKKAMADESMPLVCWVRYGYSAPLLLLVLFFIPIPKLDSTFWKVTAMALPCDIVGLLLYMEAIKVSPLSLTLPFLSLTPIFLLFTSWLILGEFPTASGLAGVILIFIGAYTLNVNDWREGIFKPFRAIASERGSWMMILVAIIYSISSNLGKIAVAHSSPVFFGCIYCIFLSLVLLPLLWFNSHGKWRGIANRPRHFMLIGFFMALMEISHFMAVSKTLVSYMISVKRTSMLFGTIYGWLIFKEENIRERLVGGLLMLIGIILIVW